MPKLSYQLPGPKGQCMAPRFGLGDGTMLAARTRKAPAIQDTRYIIPSPLLPLSFAAPADPYSLVMGFVHAARFGGNGPKDSEGVSASLPQFMKLKNMPYMEWCAVCVVWSVGGVGG